MLEQINDIDELVQSGLDFREKGDLTTAIFIYEKLTELHPDNPHFHDNLAQVLANNKDWSKAIINYQKAIDLGIENSFWAYKNLGDALREEKRLDEAISIYQECCNLNGDNPFVYDGLAQIQSLQGKYPDAIASYQKALELGIKNPFWTYQNLGDALTQENRLDEAQAAYQQAQQSKVVNPSPQNRSPQNDLDEGWWEFHHQGDAHFQQEQWHSAIALYQQAIKLNSNYFWSCYNLGRALSNLQRWEEAVTYYRKAIDLQPSEEVLVELLQELGGLFEQLNEYDQAIASYYRLTELNPHSPWAFRGLGNVLLKQGNLDRAVLAYQKSLELKSDEYHTYEMLGLTLEQQEKYNEAIDAYRRALQLEPNQNAIEQKLNLLQEQIVQFPNPEFQGSNRFENISSSMDVVVTPNEVNRQHGTGILVIRMFEQSEHILSIRSFDHYAGEQDFGEISFSCSCSGLSRAQVFCKVAQELSGARINRILCIPYFPEDVLIALAIKEIFGVKLCTYIMDDQNVHADGIPDNLMQELIEKSSLLLAISSEVRDAYEKKYNYRFWLLPGIVPQKLLQSVVCDSSRYRQFTQSKRGILVGNIWSQRWLNSLCQTIKGLDLQVDWYANLNPPGLTLDQTQLQQDGLIQQGVVPESQLVEILRKHPYTILPTGSTEEVDDRPEIAKLSLPSRLPFILATSNTPIIVIGSKATAAASFVERFDVGVVCEYSAASFLQAVEYVCLPENQTRMRQNAISIANVLSAESMNSWMWQSLEKGEPWDYKFENLLPRNQKSLVPFISPPAPLDVWRDFVPDYQSMRRLKEKGFNPDFVVDVGSSTGVWSHSINKLFPQARFILLDPLMSRYDKLSREYHIDANPNFEVVEAAVSNIPGTTYFQVSQDFYGSSLLQPNDGREYESVEVKIVNLDGLKEEKQISGQGLLKIDVQCAEHLVLEGAKNFLKQVDVIVIELSLIRFEAEAKTFREMLNLLHDLGYRYYDDAGYWREPVDGTLLQKDAVFVDKNIFGTEMHTGEF